MPEIVVENLVCALQINQNACSTRYVHSSTDNTCLSFLTTWKFTPEQEGSLRLPLVSNFKNV